MVFLLLSIYVKTGKTCHALARLSNLLKVVSFAFVYGLIPHPRGDVFMCLSFWPLSDYGLIDRKSTRLKPSHIQKYRMPSSD